MSLGHGAGVVRNGLVFYYDMSNPRKSWKGAPTTNLNTGQGLNGMSGISLSFIGLENGWKKYSISGTWNSGTYPFSMNISATTLSGGVAYSAQSKIKTNVISKFLTFGGLSYVNDGNMVSNGTSTVTSLGRDTDGLEIVFSKREGFIYSVGFANPTTNQTGYINSRPTANGVVFNSSTDFVWIKDVQVEQGTFCTPYVNTSRSNTQALLDLTNNNTITATSLTYSSDGSFTFNGSSNSLSVNPSMMPSNSSFTFNCWVNINAVSASSVIEAKNSSGGRTINVHLPWSDNNVFFDGGAVTTTYDRIIYATTANDRTGWHYWSFVKDLSNSTMRIHLDGVQVASEGSKSLSPAASTSLNIGSYTGGGTNFFNGRLSSVSMYNRALTATEVSQNFQALRGRYGI